MWQGPSCPKNGEFQWDDAFQKYGFTGTDTWYRAMTGKWEFQDPKME